MYRKKFILHHSLNINKRGKGGGPHKLRGGQKKIKKLISVPPFIWHLRVYNTVLELYVNKRLPHFFENILLFN